MNYNNKNNTKTETSKNPYQKTADEDVFSPVPLKLVTESLHPQPKNITVRKNNDK